MIFRTIGVILAIIFSDEGKHAVRNPAHRERAALENPQQDLNDTISGRGRPLPDIADK